MKDARGGGGVGEAQIDPSPPSLEKTTLKKPSLIRVKTEHLQATASFLRKNILPIK